MSLINRMASNHRYIACCGGIPLRPITVIAIFAITSALSFGQQAKPTAKLDPCARWDAHVMTLPKKKGIKAPPLADNEIAEMQSQVSLATETDPDNVKALSEKESFEAIGCLLQLEKNTKESALTGATRLDVTELFTPAPVNLAALYYISYIYTGNFKHGAAVALRGPDCQDEKKFFYATRQTCVREAYVAYQDWFAQIQTLGLAKARQVGYQPLGGTGLSWY